MLSTLDDATKKIKPETYSKLLNNVNLSEIYLVEVKAEIKRDLILKKTAIDISFVDNYKMNLESKPIHNCVKFDLITNISDTKNPFLTITAIYNVSFKVKGKVPPEFWTIYEKVSLPNQVWVYFRELIQNITSRMNIPPLTLPLFVPHRPIKS